MNLPNAISIARFASAPALVPLILFDHHAAAFWLFIVAGLSDAADGFIAKRFNSVTVLGGLLDPIADKALLGGAYVALAVTGDLPGWLVTLVVLRDVAIMFGWLWLNGSARRRPITPLWISKVNTVAQIVLAAVVLGDLAFAVVAAPLILGLVYATAATTVASGAAYMVRLRRVGASLETPR